MGIAKWSLKLIATPTVGLCTKIDNLETLQSAEEDGRTRRGAKRKANLINALALRRSHRSLARSHRSWHDTGYFFLPSLPSVCSFRRGGEEESSKIYQIGNHGLFDSKGLCLCILR